MTRRTAAALVVLLISIGVVPVPGILDARSVEAGPASVAVRANAGVEADFVARINALRASRGLPAMAVDAELTAAARSWAGTMASQGRIFHSSDLSRGVTSPWHKLGENVGVGGNTEALFNAFVNSPSHLANLVDPAFTRVGVGVVESGGRIFTAHRFLEPRAAPPPLPPTTAAPPSTAPPPTAPPTTPPPSTTPAPVTTTTTTTPATTTTVAPEPAKFGHLEPIRDLIERAEPTRRRNTAG